MPEHKSFLCQAEEHIFKLLEECEENPAAGEAEMLHIGKLAMKYNAICDFLKGHGEHKKHLHEYVADVTVTHDNPLPHRPFRQR